VKRMTVGPTPELGYVLGVLMGDGNARINNQGYGIIQLSVTDREFAEAFAEALGHILNRKVMVHYYERRREKRIAYSPKIKNRAYIRHAGIYKNWCICTSNTDFVTWFKQMNVESLSDFIVQNNLTCPFLRGFFDSEGSIPLERKTSTRKLHWHDPYGLVYHRKDGGLIIHGRRHSRYVGNYIDTKYLFHQIYAANSNLPLLWEVHQMLNLIGVKSRVWCNTCELNSYRVVITDRESIITFMKRVGFTIKRKMQALEEISRAPKKKGYKRVLS